MRFLGLGLADAVSDASTIWKFREVRPRIGGRLVILKPEPAMSRSSTTAPSAHP